MHLYHRGFLLPLAIYLLLPFLSCAQESGPIIRGYGKVFSIENPDIPGPETTEFKAVFDVYDSPAGTQGTNPQLETAARYLNMHAQSGIPKEKLKVALVVHGKASEDLLRPDFFRQKHGVENPNADLVKALLDAGVEIAICGQSATSRNIQREQTIRGVLWSLSAMSALVHYQNINYRFIKF